MPKKHPRTPTLSDVDLQALNLGRAIYYNMSLRKDCIMLLHVCDDQVHMELCTADAAPALLQAARQDIATQPLRDMNPT